MLQNRETRAGLAPRRASEAVFVGTIDGSESTPRHLDIQALRLAERFHLTISTARVVAEHAYQVGAPR